jgi:hypothetical protein
MRFSTNQGVAGSCFTTLVVSESDLSSVRDEDMNVDVVSTIQNPRAQRRFIVNLCEIKTFKDSAKVLIVALRDLAQVLGRLC